MMLALVLGVAVFTAIVMLGVGCSLMVAAAQADRMAEEEQRRRQAYARQGR